MVFMQKVYFFGPGPESSRKCKENTSSKIETNKGGLKMGPKMDGVG